MSRNAHPIPADYIVPPFPSLILPTHSTNVIDSSAYLYHTTDIWFFTLAWTIIVYGAFYVAAISYAVIVQRRNWKYLWMVSILYILVAGIEALLAGSVVGLMLAAVYNAGTFRMSTWIPFIWSVINVLVLILSSFSIQGGL